MPIIEMKVAGMTCDHCVRAVTKAIKARDEMARVSIDLPLGLVSAETRLERAEMRRAIEAEGYKVAA